MGEVKHLRVTVPGQPVPAARPRVTRNGTYTPKRYKSYLLLVEESWVQAGSPTVPDDEPLRVVVTCFMARPKSHLSASGRVKDSFPVAPVSRPDLDNLAKGLMDGLNGKAYSDDSRVVTLTAEKRYTRGDPYATIDVTCWGAK